MIYAPEMTLRDARDLYFQLSNFGADGGYNERWIKVKVWKFPIWLPNLENRRRAVRLHDLHHVLTEYPTTWRGEAEISAWEVGSGGLHRYWAGWILDLMNFCQGLAINPRGVYRAFMRGRGGKNLFAIEFVDEMLNYRVGEYRTILFIDRPRRLTAMKDRAAFVIWAVVSIVVYFAAILLPTIPVVYIGRLIFFR